VIIGKQPRRIHAPLSGRYLCEGPTSLFEKWPGVAKTSSGFAPPWPRASVAFQAAIQCPRAPTCSAADVPAFPSSIRNSAEFEFRPGPIFAPKTGVGRPEINRPPRPTTRNAIAWSRARARGAAWTLDWPGGLHDQAAVSGHCTQQTPIAIPTEAPFPSAGKRNQKT